MTRSVRLLSLVIPAVCGATLVAQVAVAPPPATGPSRLQSLGPAKTITAAECTAVKAGNTIPTSAIGEPVGGVTLSEPRWVPAAGNMPARCEVDGVMTPAVAAPYAQNINFRVVLPAEWNRRAVQQGGGGMNGSIPNLLVSQNTIGGLTPHQLGFASYGSDSGHQAGGGRRGGPPADGGRRGGPPPAPAREGAPTAPTAPPSTAPVAPTAPTAPTAPATPSTPTASPNEWTLNSEAVKNLAHMQMKKTHDAAMVVIERVYGERPRYNYWLGSSQGGREGLTVAQRYPADYNGVIADVPIVNFSSLMLAPELIRIHEKRAANWVTLAKVNAIRGEFMRQCDGLDGLTDGVINNYMGCRAIFDVKQGAANRRPWVAKRCPNNIDPNPEDTSAAACLTDGQISTLEFVYTRYTFATPLANNVRSFGMWVPGTDPSGSGLILPTRYRGQEGAAADAPVHSHLGILGVTGFLMQNLQANPLDYVEGGPLNARRVAISADLDATNPDLSAFAKRGGKMIVTIGTNDTLASPGAQLDYYESVIGRMGRNTVDGFARFFVIPQAGHGLSGNVYGTDGDGRPVQAAPIANRYERFAFLVDWVERNTAPSKTLTLESGDRTMPLCSYPTYPRYTSGAATTATSYTCAQ